MALTRSGDYRLPGRLRRLLAGWSLPLAACVPATLRDRYLARRSSYQVSSPDEAGEYQGVSARKWEALRLPASLNGKSVLDIGCSEGYFAQQCAARGAAPVVAVDASLGRLLAARFTSDRLGLDVDYRVGLFPGSSIRGLFDYVLCLSVIHHALAKKDLWKVLADPQYRDDLVILRSELSALRQLTATGGTCIVETPYEYDDPAEERRVVDFDRLGEEMVAAGFARVTCLGTWTYNPAHAAFKDRIIYVARG